LLVRVPARIDTRLECRDAGQNPQGNSLHLACVVMLLNGRRLFGHRLAAELVRNVVESDVAEVQETGGLEPALTP